MPNINAIMYPQKRSCAEGEHSYYALPHDFALCRFKGESNPIPISNSLVNRIEREPIFYEFLEGSSGLAELVQ